MTIVIVDAALEDVDAQALLVPVDGMLCRLGGATAAALRAALCPEERNDELEYVESQLERMRPLPHPEARVIDGVARWSRLVVSAAYPHDVDGRRFDPHECARMIRAAIPHAIAVAELHGITSLSLPMIGTAYRMPVELAASCLADALALSRARDVVVRWAIPDAGMRCLADAALARLL